MEKLPNIDLGKTQITEWVRVSTAAIFYQAHFGDYYQLETFIFSDDKSRIRTQQIIHGTAGRVIHEKQIDKAKKIHKRISDNLIKIYQSTEVERSVATKEPQGTKS